ESWRVGHLDAARAAQFPGDDGVLSRGGGAFFTALFTGCWWRDVFSGPLLLPGLSGRQSFPARSAVDDGSGDDGAVIRDVVGQAFELRRGRLARGGPARRRAATLSLRELRRNIARSGRTAKARRHRREPLRPDIHSSRHRFILDSAAARAALHQTRSRLAYAAT